MIGRTGHWFTATLAAVAIALPGMFGLWEPTMETLALMLVAVAISVVFGVPLGVAAGLNRRFYPFLRPVLDAMQTVPSTAYLVPAVLFFGIGPVPAAVATVIYTLAPVVRLTALGIRQVPVETVEAGHVFGSTRRQLLFKVQLPQAMPSIMTGVNQTINMALGIIVIAALVGAGGLGQEALETLRLALARPRSRRRLRDRRRGDHARSRQPLVHPPAVSRPAAAPRRQRPLARRRRDRSRGDRRRPAAGWTTFPADWGVTWADWVNDAVAWVRDNWRAQTKWLNEFLVRDVHVRITSWLEQSVAWPVLVVGAALVGYTIRGWRLALFCGLAVTAIGLVGLWDPALETLVQVCLAVVLAMIIAVPLGILAGLRPRFGHAIGPVLDGFQTIPPLVYAIPFITIFDVGIVPGGIIASVIYAIPPGIRVTALGVQSVPDTTVEAATTFGASRGQLLWGVRLPLALPAIMLAVNQVILMVVAMVIIAGLTGGGALGYLIVDTFTRVEIGRGVEVALALTLMAMILDRLTQGLAERAQPPPPTR